jgi:hypothetical protein
VLVTGVLGVFGLTVMMESGTTSVIVETWACARV